MAAGLNVLSIVTALGAAQGVFMALALLNHSSDEGSTQSAHGKLALLIFLLSLDLAEEFLYQIGVFESIPGLLHILAPIDLFYGPIIYLYVLDMTNPSKLGTDVYWHFVPVGIGVVLLVPFFLLDGADKLVLAETLRTGGDINETIPRARLINLGFTIFMSGTVVQLALYLLFSIRRLLQHARNIRNEFSDIDRINLAWLRHLLAGLSCILVLYLADQFFPDLMGVNVLGELITVVAVVLIYMIGYLGMRQPAVLTQFRNQHSDEEGDSPHESKEKYLRSGLDRESSLAFLKELTAYMESSAPYLEGDLVLPDLADRLGISSNYLSQIINEQLNVNFYDFVNGYRVREAKRLIGDARDQKLNILDIALESGFNSKSAFYAAFKKVTSMTPTQYRESL